MPLSAARAVPSDAALQQVVERFHHYRAKVSAVRPWGAFPGRVEDDEATASVLRLALMLSRDTPEAVERTAWHLAVIGVWCPLPAAHHGHTAEPVVGSPDVPLILALDSQCGPRSIRGLAHRYEHLGADRAMARAVLLRVAPEHTQPQAVLTAADHAQNRVGRRRDLRYAPPGQAPTGREQVTALMIATGRMNVF